MAIYRLFVGIFILLCSAMNSWGEATPSAKFTIYAFIPWKTNSNTPHLRSESQLKNHLLAYNIHPIKVIYEHNYFTNGAIDPKKIKQYALLDAQERDIPVSFDMEFGNRFKPETMIPKIKAILAYYRIYNSKASVGIYATIPQNTYGHTPKNFSYNQLNHNYDVLIDEIDYISPSLYNYNGRDFSAWFENARFNIEIAKKYPLKKPIIPYISPIYNLGPSSQDSNLNQVEELSESDMAKRLQALYELGASGCIIWASSQDRTKDGKFPEFNPDRGWGRAVISFIKKH